jgi:hypothetical protein
MLSASISDNLTNSPVSALPPLPHNLKSMSQNRSLNGGRRDSMPKSEIGNSRVK